MMLSLLTIKLLTSLVIFICGILSTLCPLLVANKNDVLFSSGNMMASGVLLAAGLCHQLADGSSYLNDDDGFPWSFFLCGFTFVMFLIFEETVHLVLLAASRGCRDCDAVAELDEGNGEDKRFDRSCQGSITIPSRDARMELVQGDDYGSCGAHDHEQKPLKLGKASTNDEGHLLRESSAGCTGFPDCPVTAPAIFGGLDTSTSLKNLHHHHHDDHISEHLHGSALASHVLLAALSIHSILAGLSMGIVENVAEITSTAVAIVAHKVFAGYALGSTMVAADLSLDRIVTLSLTFAISTPLGIWIGMGIEAESFEESGKSIGAVKSIVAGTFLYVSVVEVGMKELLVCRHDGGVGGDGSKMISFSERQVEALKLFSMLLGFSGMSLLAAYI